MNIFECLLKSTTMRNSKQRVIFLLFILSICYGITMAADSPCGDWEPYKDEKCIKIIDETLRTYDDTIKTCQQQENSSSLVFIRNLEEQQFFSNFLFKTHKVVDTVWIGAKYSSNKFKWADDSDVSFTNWAEGNPSNTVDRACVQMIPEVSSMGKWADEPCNKKNLVVCQKMQTWSLSRLQKTLLDARKDLQDSLEDVKKQLKKSEENRKQLNSSLEDARNHINKIERNPLPIGFIYVQLPGQPEPKTLWSVVEWRDVTSDYAGLFFRAEGGNAATFGQTQDENSPRLTSIGRPCNTNMDEGGEFKIQPGVWTNRILTGAWTGDRRQLQGLTFLVSSGEVRPRNKAVRIWKRIN